MPVDFLTEDQKERYGRYAGEPSPEQLARYFHLDDTDLALIRRRRGDHNRLGFAAQLCSARFLGTFVSDVRDVPNEATAYLCQQLELPSSACLARYPERLTTAREHTAEIRKHCGYREFGDQPEHWRLIKWLYVRSWLGAERPSVLFDLVTARLVERKILLPGVTTLSRLVASIRDRSAQRLWRVLTKTANAEHSDKLVSLLNVDGDSRQSHLDRLRKAPTRVSGPALVGALERLEEIRSYRVSEIDLSHVPPSKLTMLARYAAVASAQTVSRMHPDRKLASLIAFAHVFEATAMDDALDVFDMLVTEIIRSAELCRKKERWRTLRDLDTAALLLRDACQIVLDNSCDDLALREKIFSVASEQALTEATQLVESLARPADQQHQKELIDSYQRVRRFLPKLLQTVQFQPSPAGEPIACALEFLASIEGKNRPDMSVAPIGIATRGWKRLVIRDGQVDRRAYTLCVLEQLQESLRRRDIYVEPSQRWGDPRAKLISESKWSHVKPQVCSSLGHCEDAADQLDLLAKELDKSYQRVAANFQANDAVEIEQQDGRDTLKVSSLEKNEEPASLLQLKEDVQQLLPRIELPQVILEIQLQTGFLDEFTHVSEGNARVSDLHVSLCAVLVAEACNIGLEPLIRHDVPALTRRRLSWVQQNYIRADTLAAANARLVDAQSEIPLALQWGGGEVASADGLRFVVPVRTINARPNSKYFGTERGITYYNFTSDQFSGFHGIVIPGTLRDSMFVLDGLLEQQTKLNPRELMTDTAGVSDVVFGLFWLLGYQFSPRMADIGESRFWRIDSTADYGPLNGVARNRISTRLIANNWDDILRVAGSLKTGKVSASELIRSLLRSKRPSTLTRAIAEVGRISKTFFQLDYIDSESYRRRILTQLNRGESRNSLARATFHGRRGQIRHAYREGQEDQLGSLGLVVNVMALWNTIYMQAALEKLREDGLDVRDEDVARLSPMEHGHINFLGSYSFSLDDEVSSGHLRPLRSLAEIEELVA